MWVTFSFICTSLLCLNGCISGCLWVYMCVWFKLSTLKPCTCVCVYTPPPIPCVSSPVYWCSVLCYSAGWSRLSRSCRLQRIPGARCKWAPFRTSPLQVFALFRVFMYERKEQLFQDSSVSSSVLSACGELNLIDPTPPIPCPASVYTKENWQRPKTCSLKTVTSLHIVSRNMSQKNCNRLKQSETCSWWLRWSSISSIIIITLHLKWRKGKEDIVERFLFSYLHVPLIQKLLVWMLMIICWHHLTLSLCQSVSC